MLYLVGRTHDDKRPPVAYSWLMFMANDTIHRFYRIQQTLLTLLLMIIPNISTKFRVKWPAIIRHHLCSYYLAREKKWDHLKGRVDKFGSENVKYIKNNHQNSKNLWTLLYPVFGPPLSFKLESNHIPKSLGVLYQRDVGKRPRGEQT